MAKLVIEIETAPADYMQELTGRDVLDVLIDGLLNSPLDNYNVGDYGELTDWNTGEFIGTWEVYSGVNAGTIIQ